MRDDDAHRPHFFDLSDIDWDDEADIDRVAQMIWTIADEERNRDDQ